MLTDILTALVVIVAVGFVFGILLALCIKLCGIEEDEKKKRVRDVLPGINCGACGYKGCNDYAEALFAGKAKPNLCIPGAESTARELGEILGIDNVEEPEDKIAFVHCNGTCDAACERAIYNGINTCKASAMTNGGPKACLYGCLGCGDCAKVCVSGAICLEAGIARIDTARCIGCGLCVAECPKKIISMIPQEAAAAVFCNSKDKGADARKACTNACIGCKKCEKTCPNQAISVVNNCAVIDYERCSGCGACADVCPTECLKRVSCPDIPEDFSISK